MNVVVTGHPSNFQIVKQIPKLSRNMLENVKHAKKRKRKEKKKKKCHRQYNVNSKYVIKYFQ